MSNHNDTATEKSAFTVTRIINAPRKLVFKAWTQPEHMEKWWGPKDFTMITYRMDLRVGGEYLYGMKSSEGIEMWGKLVFREIIEPEKLSFVVSFTNENGKPVRHPLAPTWPLETLNTVNFIEEGNKTMLVMRAVPINATQEEHDTFEGGHASMNQGYNGTIDKLEAYVNQLK